MYALYVGTWSGFNTGALIVQLPINLRRVSKSTKRTILLPRTLNFLELLTTEIPQRARQPKLTEIITNVRTPAMKYSNPSKKWNSIYVHTTVPHSFIISTGLEHQLEHNATLITNISWTKNKKKVLKAFKVANHTGLINALYILTTQVISWCILHYNKHWYCYDILPYWYMSTSSIILDLDTAPWHVGGKNVFFIHLLLHILRMCKLLVSIQETYDIARNEKNIKILHGSFCEDGKQAELVQSRIQ
jgi:hypothetical protein